MLFVLYVKLFLSVSKSCSVISKMHYKSAKMGLIKLWWLFCVFVVKIRASTHWMVTEGGLIQPRLDSPFEIEHPYDLLAFLNQDTRWDNIINLYHDLVHRQHILNTLWRKLDKEIDKTTLLNQNDHCINVGHVNLIDWYTSSSEEEKPTLGNEQDNMNDVEFDSTNVPDCKKISSLTFSMCAFEHLQGMKQRENLSADPEVTLPERIFSQNSDLSDMTVDQFGSWLSGILRKNTSSWLHYNMASLYWRVRGNAPKAMECSRRAVHYAPRDYKDVALLSMGLILHRSKMTEDAIIVLGAAVDHDDYCPMNHFILGNSYAIVGEFNSSIKHYDKCLKLNPTFKVAAKFKHAVKCHIYIEQQMKVIKEIVFKLRDELREYIYREHHWLRSQAALLRTMKQPEGYDHSDIGQNYDRISEITKLDIKAVRRDSEKYSVIQYFFDGPAYKDDWLQEKGINCIDSANHLQRLVKHISRHAKMSPAILTYVDDLEHSDWEILKEIGPTPNFNEVIPEPSKDTPKVESKEVKVKVESQKPSDKKPDKKPLKTDSEENMSEFDTGVVIYPVKLKVSRTTEEFDTDSEWPSKKLCKETAPSLPSNLEAIYQVFLPFENKGIRLKTLLTDKLGVPSNVEHELPWHPPTCPNNKEAAVFTQKKPQKPQFTSSVIVTDSLRLKLLDYVGNGNVDSVKHMQDAEIGQRIYAAMQLKLAPKWLLYTLSSLYWRVRSNNMNALHCVMTASRTVESRYKDIVLVSLASIYLEMGYFDEALTAAEEAFKINLYEPATNFILSELNMIKQHKNTHMFHLKQVIRVDPNFMGGIARSLLIGWTCLFKKVISIQENFGEGDICTQVEPGMNMVCEKDGTNCHLTNIQCFSAHEKGEDGSTLIRMMDLKEETAKAATATDDIDINTFDQFVENIPLERTDKTGHQKNFNAMIKTVGKVLKGCGNKGCASKEFIYNSYCIQADDLALKEEDCTNQHLELGYWLHIISFREILTETESKIPSEIVATSPTKKMVPECSIPVNPSDDFFVERMMKVDTDGWEPVLSLMHQFAEVINFFDYVTLGAKLAKHVEIHNSEWLSAAAAGWWCGAAGRGACAVRCLSAAHALAPTTQAPLVARALAAMLHIQRKHRDAKDVAYLSFYAEPKSKIDAFLVGVSHTYLAEYEPAVWMYRYALTFDEKFLPAKACLHATMCLMLFGETKAKT